MRSFLSVNANRSSRQRSFSPSQHVTHYSLRVRKPRSCRKPSVKHGGGSRNVRARAPCRHLCWCPRNRLVLRLCWPCWLCVSAEPERGRPLPDKTRCSLTGFRTRTSCADAPACASSPLWKRADVRGCSSRQQMPSLRGDFTPISCNHGPPPLSQQQHTDTIRSARLMLDILLPLRVHLVHCQRSSVTWGFAMQCRERNQGGRTLP